MTKAVQAPRQYEQNREAVVSRHLRVLSPIFRFVFDEDL
jgi:hypothetical protein